MYKNLDYSFLILVILALVLTFLLLPLASANQPIPISSCEDLQNMQNDLSADYYLTNNIDCSDTINWNDGDGFRPISTFTGSLDGQNYKIINWYSQDTQADYVSLIDTLFGVVKNLKLDNSVAIITRDWWGGSALVGEAQSGSLIENIKGRVKVEHTGITYFSGALIGYSHSDSVLRNVNIKGNVSSNNGGFYMGGIVGEATGDMENIRFEGNVSMLSGGDRWYVGGIGGAAYGQANNVYFRGNVLGGTRVGGLFGQFHGDLERGYALGNVSATGSIVGGLIGRLGGASSGSVSNSFATASVSGSSTVGGLIGNEFSGSTSNSFWDINISGTTNSQGGTGKSTSEMKNISTFTDTSTTGLDTPWDFFRTGGQKWDVNPVVNDGYPFLVTLQQDTELFCYFADSCGSDERVLGVISQTSNYDNSHAQLPNHPDNYTYGLCCRSKNQDLGSSCSALTSKEILRLAEESNSHVQTADAELITQTYDHPVCVAGSEGSTVCEVSTSGNPDSDLYACMGSLASSEENSGDFNLTNAHIASCDYYDLNVYCRLNNPPSLSKSVLSSSFGSNYTFENLTVTGNAFDLDGDDVTVGFDWRESNESLALINAPFLAGDSDDSFTKDFSTNGFDFTSGSGVEFNPSGGIDGVGGYVFDNESLFETDFDDVFFTDEFSLSFWMKPNDSDTLANIVGIQDFFESGGCNDGGWIVYHIFESIGFGYCRTDNNNQFYESSEYLVDGVWNNVVISYTSSELLFYLNGEKVDSFNPSLEIDFSLPQYNLMLGKVQGVSGNPSFEGELDKFLFTDYILSADQIRQLFEEGNRSLSGEVVRDSSLVSGETSPGDVFSVLSFASDGIDLGEALLSNELLVTNQLEVYLDSPEDEFFTASENVVFECSAVSNTGVVDLALHVWDSEGVLVFNETESVGGALEVDESWNITLSEGEFEWSCFGSSVDGLSGYAVEGNRSVVFDTSNVSVDFVPPTPEDESFVSDDFVSVNASVNTTNLGNLSYDWNGSEYSVYDESLVLMMNFDNVSSLGEDDSFVRDISLYSNDASLEGPTYSSGKFGSALDFAGNDEFAVINDSPEIVSDDLEELTLSFWLYPRDDSGFMSVLGTTSNWFGDGYNVYLRGGNEDAEFAFTIDGWSVREGNIRQNEWQHITAVYDGDLMSLYLDGELIGTESGKSGPIVSDELLHIGIIQNYNQNSLDGSIDELRIWNRSLSSEEIVQNYKSNLRKVESGLWNFVSSEENLSEGDYTASVSAFSRTGLFDSETRSFTVTGDVPIGLSPVGDITNRRPLFNWTDINSADSYELNVTAPSGANCFGFFEEGITSSSFESEVELCTDLDYDSTSENYTWQVRACSGGSCGEWSESAEFDVLSVNSIELVEDSVGFGSLQPGDNVSTAGGISPMRVRNLGNIRVGVEGSANESLFDEASLGGDAFQFFSNMTIGDSFDEGLVSPAWLNVSGVNQNLLTQLGYIGENDAFIHYRVSVPGAEVPGSKQSGITVESVPND